MDIGTLMVIMIMCCMALKGQPPSSAAAISAQALRTSTMVMVNDSDSDGDGVPHAMQHSKAGHLRRPASNRDADEDADDVDDVDDVDDEVPHGTFGTGSNSQSMDIGTLVMMMFRMALKGRPPSSAGQQSRHRLLALVRW
jgi:hypothetical protein